MPKNTSAKGHELRLTLLTLTPVQHPDMPRDAGDSQVGCVWGHRQCGVGGEVVVMNQRMPRVAEHTVAQHTPATRQPLID